MPFQKITSGKDKGKYRSPTGRVFTQKQVDLYHANNGFPSKSTRSPAKRPRKKAGRR